MDVEMPLIDLDKVKENNDADDTFQAKSKEHRLTHEQIEIA